MLRAVASVVDREKPSSSEKPWPRQQPGAFLACTSGPYEAKGYRREIAENRRKNHGVGRLSEGAPWPEKPKRNLAKRNLEKAKRRCCARNRGGWSFDFAPVSRW